MPVDPLAHVLKDVRERYKAGERKIRVPSTWRKYFALLNDRIFGGN